MEYDVFADEVGFIGIDNGVVRINLTALSPIEKDADGKPVPVFARRVIFPIDGFLRSYSVMERFVNQLVEAGVVTRATQDKKVERK